MAESGGDDFVIRYVPDFSAVDAGWQERERRAQQGFNVGTGQQTVHPTAPGQAPAVVPPPPTQPPLQPQTPIAPSVAAQYQQAMNAAQARGNPAAAAGIAQTAAQFGVNLQPAVPLPPGAVGLSPQGYPVSGQGFVVGNPGQTSRDRALLAAQEMGRAQQAEDQRRQEEARIAQQNQREAEQQARENERNRERQASQVRDYHRRLDRIPEADRDFVGRQTAERMVTRGESMPEAIRESTRIYNEDTQAHRRFLTDRQRAQDDVINGYRRLARDTIGDLGHEARRDLRRFNADFAETGQARHPFDFFGPARQRQMLQERMAGLEPESDEFQDLRRRDAMLQRRTGLHTEIMRTGMFMNLLFGGMELSHAASAIRTGDLGARLALSQQDALQAQLQGLRGATSGFVGGTASELVNAFGSVFGTPSIARFEDTVQTQKFRGENLDFTRQVMFENRQSEAVRNAYQTGGAFGQNRQQLVNAAELRRRASTEAAGDLTSQLGMPGDMGFWHDVAVRINFGERSTSLRKQYQDAADAEKLASPEMQSLRARRDAILAQQREQTASDRLTLEQFDIQQQEMRFANRDVFRAAGERLIDLPSREVQRRDRARENAKELREVYREGDGMLFVQTVLRQQRQDKLAERDAERQEVSTISQLRFGNNATALAQQGFNFQAAQQAINQRFNPQIVNGRITAFGNVLANDPRFAEMSRGYTLAQQNAQADEQRRLIIDQATHDAMAATFNRQPLLSGITGLEGQRNAALLRLTNPAEISRVNRRIDDQEKAQVQSRIDQITDVNASQTTRARQLAALLARDPFGAEAEGIYGRARDEERQLMRQGLGPQATRARRLGQQALALERQNYIDSFRGVQLENSEQLYSVLFNRKDNENPAHVLREIDDRRHALDTPAEKDKSARDQSLDELPDKIAAALAKYFQY